MALFSKPKPALALTMPVPLREAVLPAKVEEKRFPANVGVEHPFDLKRMERWYTDDAFVNGVVEKHVDFVVGGGFRARSKDARVQEILDRSIRDLEFETLLRDWLRRGFVTGQAYFEIIRENNVPVRLNVLDSKFIYVRLKKRQDGKLTNEVEGYSQFIDLMTTPKPFLIKEKDVAAIHVNRINDNPYGNGLIRPMLFSLEKKSRVIQDLCTQIHRKATAKTLFIVGDRTKDYTPPSSDMEAFGQRLEAQTNLTDFVVGPFTDVKTIDYGDVGKNYLVPLDALNRELVVGSQVPEVIMGMGNIAEGLAAAQMKAWLFRIRSIQEEVEKVIEQKIFRPIIEANGLNAEDVEFEWGVPTPDDRAKEIDMLKGLLQLANPMSPLVSPDFRAQTEERLRELLGFDPAPETQDDELGAPQPEVPPEGIERPTEESLELHSFASVRDGKTITLLDVPFQESLWDVVPLKEYVGWNYDEYLSSVVKFIESERFIKERRKTFKYLPGTGQTEWTSTTAIVDLKDTLTTSQVSTLRGVLVEGLREGESIGKIKNSILKQVKPGELELDNGVIITPEARALMLARTEVIRASNEGFLTQAMDDGVEQFEWVAAIGERTCNYCSDQNGEIFESDDASGNIPAHPNCRCRMAPVVRLTTSAKPEVTTRGDKYKNAEVKS